MSEGTDASISGITQFGTAASTMLTDFTTGATAQLETIASATIGATGLPEGANAAAYHAMLTQSAGELLGDVIKGLQSLGAGALTIAANYADADARQQSEMTTVWNAFHPDGGPTVSAAMAQAAAENPGGSPAQQLRTTGQLPAPTTTAPPAQNADQAAMDQVEADREEYGQDAHQNWLFGHDDLVDAPEPEPEILAPGAPGTEPTTGNGTVTA
ncbi:hypothetical protein [Modestobacter versicolor]|uniref:Uncharacterized protein n=1 Tax=Modestobacter versicolor TaxID=429133 RepID=A0A323VH63_9ACTN|nr:hypothetical protein [Modestobacter versicolor]MBB3677836.1 hypothetical protein [Modestobacter versicolor]PZA23343.1 hypothetical protein DMO24_00400 [Modestobacter versicolor]